MKHSLILQTGPVRFRIGSEWAAPITALRQLYARYPAPDDNVPHFTVRLESVSCWRRLIRPSVRIAGDFMLPEAAPLPLAHGLLAAEMAMNLQVALGERRFLLIHAASVEKDGRALILSGESGSGKSTLAALLAERGWRFMGDEFALIDLATGAVVPFPRPTSLKNAAIDVLEAEVAADRFGPRLKDTPKGDIRHLVPQSSALDRMQDRAPPALLLFPQYGDTSAIRGMGQSEVFVRLTQASTNYVALGEAGHAALIRLVRGMPAHAMAYPDTASAVRQINRLWKALP